MGKREKKSGKKTGMGILLVAFLIFAVILGLWLWKSAQEKKNSGSSADITVSAGPGESIIYATLYTVRGNEITYYETTGNVQSTELTDEQSGAAQSMSSADGKQAALQTAFIPVGTPVTTKLGTVTTFSRLAAGDNVALVTADVDGEIEAVYIVD